MRREAGGDERRQQACPAVSFCFFVMYQLRH